MLRLFDDKSRDWTRPLLQPESTYSFLDRSSLPEYERLRCMLQRWVDRFPSEHQPHILGQLRHKGHGSRANDRQFNAGFFELFLHEFLNGTGGRVEAQPSHESRTPDFRVTQVLEDRPDFSYMVEATDLDLETSTSLERNQNELSVFDKLNEISSPDFRLSLETEGTLLSTPPLRKLKQHFEDLIRETAYDDQLGIYIRCGQDPMQLPSVPPFSHGNWKITGRLIPVLPEGRPNSETLILLYPPRVGHFDDIGKTKARLEEKIGQHPNAQDLIIALRCNLTNDRLDEALLGRLGSNPDVRREGSNAVVFHGPFVNRRKDGFWANNSGPRNQNVIGVVAFYDLYPWFVGNATAIFYSNPYVNATMPEWTNLITHAEYSDGKVSVVEGKPPHSFMRDYEVIGNPFG